MHWDPLKSAERVPEPWGQAWGHEAMGGQRKGRGGGEGG